MLDHEHTDSPKLHGCCSMIFCSMFYLQGTDIIGADAAPECWPGVYPEATSWQQMCRA